MVLWAVFRGGKHIATFERKNQAARRAKSLASKAKVLYWVHRKEGVYDLGKSTKA